MIYMHVNRLSARPSSQNAYECECGSSVGGVSWIGEKPKFPAAALFREGGFPKSESPRGLPFGRPMNGFNVYVVSVDRVCW